MSPTSPATRFSASTLARDWRKFTAHYEPKIKAWGLDNPDDLETMCKIAAHGIEDGKGIIYGGNVGNGKTTRLRFISEEMGIAYTDARTLCLQCAGLHRKSGEFMEVCNCQIYGNIIGDNYHRKHDLIIDDLGTEAERQTSFGNNADVMAAVLDARWYEWEREGWRTFFATNLTSQMLAQAYGERTFSRLLGMCCFIALPGGDRRAQR
jgi:hypothetical protein